MKKPKIYPISLEGQLTLRFLISFQVYNYFQVYLPRDQCIIRHERKSLTYSHILSSFIYSYFYLYL